MILLVCATLSNFLKSVWPRILRGIEARDYWSHHDPNIPQLEQLKLVTEIDS